MKELFSNADDCYELEKKLNKKLKGKIDFGFYVYLEVVSGKYHIFPLNECISYTSYRSDELNFHFKFCRNGFLRITLENGFYKATMGHKLAALGDFCKALSDEFGKPTLFYTIKNDDQESINVQWSFCNRDEVIASFKNDTAFEDESVERLIIIDEPGMEKSDEFDATRELFSTYTGLPFELAGLVDENAEDFIKYKPGLGQSKDYMKANLAKRLVRTLNNKINEFNN